MLLRRSRDNHQSNVRRWWYLSPNTARIVSFTEHLIYLFYGVFTSDTLNDPVKTQLSNGVCNVGTVLNKLTQISLSQLHVTKLTMFIQNCYCLGTEFAIESVGTGVKFFVFSNPYVFYDCESQSMLVI